MSSNELDDLIELAAEAVEENKATQNLQEIDIFNTNESNKKLTTAKSKDSLLHNGDTDSSDDDDNRNVTNRKYSEYGRNIKHTLESSTIQTHNFRSTKNRTSTRTSWISKPQTGSGSPTNLEPILGLKIVNPLVSSETIKERMIGRDCIQFSGIKNYLLNNPDRGKNWVIAGVLVARSPVKRTQRDQPFIIWTLSDLRNDIKTVSLFLFADAYKEFWKTAIGTALGVLNPNVFENKRPNSKDEASLSVDNGQKIMVLGQSRDFGTCKSTKQNGDKCTAIVNISICEYCIYHMKKEYQMMSKRIELQSPFGANNKRNFGLSALRNKVLGKNEVFYAGKSFTAQPIKKTKKMLKLDENRLTSLESKTATTPQWLVQRRKTRKQTATQFETSSRQRLKDLELLEKLGCKTIDEAKTDLKLSGDDISVSQQKELALNVIRRLKEKTTMDDSKMKELSFKPKLSGAEMGSIDFSLNSRTVTNLQNAKQQALNYVQTYGPIKKTDPNQVKKSQSSKRSIIAEDPKIRFNEPPEKKVKISENPIISDRFRKMLNTQSSHMDLLEVRDREKQEKYFGTLEMKERIEDKLIGTFKVPCKAVRCLQCKYTSFSASDLCKSEGHPLKVFDAVKRFFKCGNCQNRTVCLDVVPTKPCTNCNTINWQKTGMIKEKITTIGPVLSIRGGEQKFINSNVTKGQNIDLLLPDQD